MPDSWTENLKHDPLPRLDQADDEAVHYFVRRDLLEEEVGPVEVLWDLPPAARLINKQERGGSWRYHGGNELIRSQSNYDQLETYRILSQLVEKYGLTRAHPAVSKAADFLFSFQTEEGDFRGIYGGQYTPNYSAAIMEVLIKAGHDQDSRIDKGFGWLLSIRQNDGGWVIPFRTASGGVGKTLGQALANPTCFEPDRSMPFSHLVTGVVLRAFAAHPEYRKTAEAKMAGELLASRFFKSDEYVDRQSAGFWIKIRYPFWFTDIVSALDSLSLLGFSKDHPRLAEATGWLVTKQQDNGLWKSPFKGREDDYWITLAVCRILKRLLILG